MGGTSMKDVGGASFAGSSPPFLGRERAAVDVDVGPERRSPRYHETLHRAEDGIPIQGLCLLPYPEGSKPCSRNPRVLVLNTITLGIQYSHKYE